MQLAKKEMAPQFLWQVSEAGYEWQKGDDGLELHPAGKARRVYSPPADLFLQIAQIELGTKETNDAIQAFADRFGLLSLADAKGGESRDLWPEHISGIAKAVKLWGLITEQPNELKKYIRWPNRRQVEFAGAERRTAAGKAFRDTTTIASFKHRPELLDRFRYGDSLQPARTYLQNIINERLDQLVDYRMHWTPDCKKMAAAPTPRDLAGFLWLSLALAIRDSSTFRPCASCGTILIVAAEGSPGIRSQRRTCSNACRMALSRQRHQADKPSTPPAPQTTASVLERSRTHPLAGGPFKSRVTG
jgi:hypothetical protein